MIRVTGDAEEFKARVGPLLLRDPVLHTVLLTHLAERADGNGGDDHAEPTYFSVHRGGVVAGAAMATARVVALGGLPMGLVPDLVGVVAEFVPTAQMVEGLSGVAQRFSAAYAARLGREFSEAQAMRLYRLGKFVAHRADGRPRLATEGDIELASRLIDAFGHDVGEPLVDPEAWARDRIDVRRLWFWENNGRVVSMAGHRGAAAGAARIGPVYTPVADRGQGYGSALTSHLTERILDGGMRPCLFTDLANPTSNKIYAAIGYRALADFKRYKVR
ncbi:GNAT family N-acetyltransferase [Kribbella turkmenica]|uniref:GNAT family N-acetyltransferase n=1 Tax=Kribbella turkmenica TaxID=2530375 RepID=UPI001404BC5F|nr:GNAT family N-acetyltransferase [Kribbella turkmenica]